MGGNMATVDAGTDIEGLALLFARLQSEHAGRSDEEARKASCDAIRSWGERVPDDLVARPRAAK